MLFLCTLLHFTVDGVCAAVLAKYAVYESNFGNIVYYFSLYNLIAFGGQWIAGLFLDIKKKFVIPFFILTPIFLGLGIISSLGILNQVILIAIGNCIFHVAGGVLVLRKYNTFKEPGIFVSSGAIGLGLGLNLIVGALPFEIVCIYATFMLIRYELKASSLEVNEEYKGINLNLYNKQSFSILLIGTFLLLACIILRGFRGHANIPEYIMLLPCTFAMGKSLGGLFCDIFGYKKTIISIFILSFFSLQLIAFDFSGIWGIMPLILLTFAFNMTMPLTLRLIHWYFPEYPGLTFGLAAGCLLPGAFYGKILYISPIVMIVIQFLSLFIAGFIFQRYGKHRNNMEVL